MFESISPLEYRYLDIPEAAQVREFLSEQAFIRYMAKVECALVKAYFARGMCAEEAVRAVEKACREITAEEVYEEEKKIRHQVRAMVNCLSYRAKEAASWLHLGATSHDILCTADSLRYKDFSFQMLIPLLLQLEKRLIDLARREKRTAQIGRTHGQHAVPLTFGFAIASYVSRIGGRIEKILLHAGELRGKFSGAVGAYNAQSLLVEDPILFEQEFLAQLGLRPADHSTQIVEPEYLADFLHVLTSTFGVLANLADDMRHLQRSEIDEVMEGFDNSQVGSSTMPHKRNPVGFENVKSLYKTFMPRMVSCYLDQVSEHQRDLTNSASSRFVGETLAGLYLAARRMEKTMEKLVVHPEALQRNMRLNPDKVLAEPCYLMLAKRNRQAAHETVRTYVQNGGKDLSRMLDGLGVVLSEKERDVLSDPEHYLGLSCEKTEQVCDRWEGRIEEIRKTIFSQIP